MTDSIPPDLARILRETPKLASAYLVGGCVRDWLLGLPNKDYDVEVFHLDYESLAKTLTPWGRVDLVGRSFGVVKLTTQAHHTYDFSIPRRDSKTAAGHRGFAISFNPNLSLEEAAARRDFTVNALMYHFRESKLLDFHGGARDLKEGILRHTSSAFPEDPLRVLRGMQFASRFRLTAASETIELSRSIKQTFPELARERIREEWLKWAERSVIPSFGLKFLRDTEWIEHFPEIAALQGVSQDPEWHPEGDVFVHTCHCCDAMAALPEFQQANRESRITYMLAILGHDFGKAVTTTTAIKKGVPRIISPGHESVSGPLAQSFLERINVPHRIQDRVIPLVINHMAHYEEVTDRAIRRLAKRLEPENIAGLLTVMTADAMGQPPPSPLIPANLQAIAAKAEELQLRKAAPVPILLGRHLIDLGYAPGKDFGIILHAAYQAQLEGQFQDFESALAWLQLQPWVRPAGRTVARSAQQS